MSTVYKNLSDEDLKIENESLNALEKQLEPKGFEKNFKTIIILGFILSLASAVGSAYLYKAINKEKRKREALEASQIQIREKAGVMEQDTARSKSEINKLRQQLRAYSTQRADFEKKLEQSRQEVSQLRTKLKELEAKSDAINKAADKVQTELGLSPVVSGAKTVANAASSAVQNAAVPSAAKSFQVLTVNRKFNFVVVNFGLKDSAKIGDALTLQRDGKTVGQAAIEKIYDNFAAATIVKENKEAPIKEGDKVSKA